MQMTKTEKAEIFDMIVYAVDMDHHAYKAAGMTKAQFESAMDPQTKEDRVNAMHLHVAENDIVADQLRKLIEWVTNDTKKTIENIRKLK